MGEERRRETVDLPVAREPVRPMRSIFFFEVGGWVGGEVNYVARWVN